MDKRILILRRVIIFLILKKKNLTWLFNRYIRTSSKEYTTKVLNNRMIHLTNDAV